MSNVDWSASVLACHSEQPGTVALQSIEFERNRLGQAFNRERKILWR